MWFLSLFTSVVFAAEMVISPIPDDGIVAVTSPDVTFGQLLNYSPPQVLGVSTEPTPTPTPLAHRKNSYTIALLGDSMIDTLGPDLGHLRAELRDRYPGVSFTLLNFGVGAENIEMGARRLEPVLSKNPDIVVVESFAYNPFIEPEGELDRHWLALSKIVDSFKNSSHVMIAATIAPNASIFGDGVLNWDAKGKAEKVERINALLDNTVKFAKSQNLPLTDAYHPSGGNIKYINPGDHIHYSDLGREFFSRLIASAIVKNKLLE